LTVAIVFAVLVGLAIGSFANVVAYRLPRGESLLRPPSHCPECGHPIRAYDNVPVVSWLVLRGRCRDCRAAIPPRYPLVEAATGVLFGAIVGVRWDDATAIALGLVLVAFLVPLTLIDLDVRRLPNALVYPCAAAGLVLGTALDPGGEPERLIAAAIAFAVFLLAALVYPAGMGMGDVKLAGVLGLYLGRDVAVAIAAALLLALAVGLAIIARKGVAAGRKTAVPFGPFLAAGAVIGILVGPQLMDAYLNGF
jgi:leader peptidase (prepilin peptidase)/N-methyltransferase